MLTVSYETLLNLSFLIVLGCYVGTLIWQGVHKGSKAADIANDSALAAIVIVEILRLTVRVMNNEPWLGTLILCCMWVLCFLLKAITYIIKD